MRKWRRGADQHWAEAADDAMELMSSDIVKCQRKIGNRTCGEVMLQQVNRQGMAVLYCPECRFEQIVQRRPPPPPKWRSPTIIKPCAVLGCTETICVPKSHPSRIMYCRHHSAAARRRLARLAKRLAREE